eukprot:scaffold20.g7894.t1
MTLAATPTGPAYQVLYYNYVPNILERRDPYRPQHLQHAKQFAAEGKLALAGALLEPVDSALFVFHNTSREEIEEFVKDDPAVHGCCWVGCPVARPLLRALSSMDVLAGGLDGEAHAACPAPPGGATLHAFLGSVVFALLLLAFAYFSYCDFLRRHGKLRAAAELAGMDAEQLRRMLSDVDLLPEWARMPDVERAPFANQILAQARLRCRSPGCIGVVWPNVECAAIKMALADNFLERLMNSTTFWRPAFLARSGVRILGLSLGPVPPTLAGIKAGVPRWVAAAGAPQRAAQGPSRVFPQPSGDARRSAEAVVLEVEFAWASRMDLRMAIRILPDQYASGLLGRTLAGATTVRMGVRDMVIRGKARITVRPLLDEIPVAGGLKVSLMGAPEFSYRTSVLGGNPAFIRGLDSWINEFIKDVVLRPFLWPDGFVLDLAHLGATAFETPEGILNVQLVDATNLPRMDLIGRADPYVQLSVADKGKASSSVRSNTLEPVWNEEFPLLVHDSKQQRLKVALWDSETLLPDRLMGEVELPLEALDLSGAANDVWIPVPRFRKPASPAYDGAGTQAAAPAAAEEEPPPPPPGGRAEAPAPPGGAPRLRRWLSKGGVWGRQLAPAGAERPAEPPSEAELWRQRLHRLRRQQQLVQGSMGGGGGAMEQVWHLAAQRLHLLRQSLGSEMLVHLRVTYLRFAQQPAAGGARGGGGAAAAGAAAAMAAAVGVLHVHIDRAEKLVARKAGGFAKNMAVRVAVGSSGRYVKSTERGTAKAMVHRTDPIFEQTLEFIIDGVRNGNDTARQSDAEVSVSIWTFHLLLKPKFKGQVSFPLQDVVHGKRLRLDKYALQARRRAACAHACQAEGRWRTCLPGAAWRPPARAAAARVRPRQLSPRRLAQGVASGSIFLELRWTSAIDNWQL